MAGFGDGTPMHLLRLLDDILAIVSRSTRSIMDSLDIMRGLITLACVPIRLILVYLVAHVKSGWNLAVDGASLQRGDRVCVRSPSLCYRRGKPALEDYTASLDGSVDLTVSIMGQNVGLVLLIGISLRRHFVMCNSQITIRQNTICRAAVFVPAAAGPFSVSVPLTKKRLDADSSSRLTLETT